MVLKEQRVILVHRINQDVINKLPYVCTVPIRKALAYNRRSFNYLRMGVVCIRERAFLDYTTGIARIRTFKKHLRIALM